MDETFNCKVLDLELAKTAWNYSLFPESSTCKWGK